MVKKLAWGLLALLLALAAVLGVNTLRKGSRQLDVAPLPVLPVDEAGAAQRLAEAVRLRTISSRTTRAQCRPVQAVAHAAAGPLSQDPRRPASVRWWAT